MTTARRWLARGWLFGAALWDQAARDRILIRASGLAFASLLAAVPLVAVLFSLFSAFGALDELKARVQELLFAQLLPTRQGEIVAYLNEFTENAGRLGLTGFLFLVASALLLLDGIESNFNDIWHARNRRRLVSKLTAYTSVLVFGTLFLGASLSLSARVKTLFFTGGILDRALLERGLVRRTLDASLPLALTVAGFLLIYLIVPYARVRLRSAALGAVAAGLLWEVAKHVFANSVGQSVRYSTIYGSLAAFPIFLVWLYVTWVLVLLGLEIAFTHQHFAALERRLAAGGEKVPDPLTLGLRLFALIARRFEQGESPPTNAEVAESSFASLEAVDGCTERWLAAGLLRRTGEANGEAGGGLLPARPLAQIQVAEVTAALLAQGGAPPVAEPLDREVDALVRTYRAAGRDALAGRTVQDLLDATRPAAARPASSRPGGRAVPAPAEPRDPARTPPPAAARRPAR